MTTNTFDLTGTIRRVHSAGTTHGVLLRRTFATSVEELWKTCTEPGPLSRWIGELRGDPETGTVELSMDGGAYVAGCEILRCEPPHVLELVWSFEGEDDSVVRATLAAVENGTELTLEHLALTSDAGIGYGAGWEEFMADLEDALAARERSHECDALEREAAEIWTTLPVDADDRWGTLGQESFSVVRTFAATPERVWGAISTESGLSSWFGEAHGDLHEGGSWGVGFDDGRITGTISECVPLERVRTTFVQGDDEREHDVLVEVESVAAGSRLTLTHTYDATATAAQRRGLAAGWNAHLAGLAAELTSAVRSDDAWFADYRIAMLVHRHGR